MLKILVAPNPVLAQKVKEIKKIDETITSLIEEMKVTLAHTSDPEGVGLAAPQIGRSLALFIIREDPEKPFTVFINPKMKIIKVVVPKKKELKKKKNDSVTLEGCLSLPTIWGPVTRHPKIELTYLDEKGRKQTQTFTGFFATIVQHEFDHLQGVLFPKRVIEEKGQLYKSRKDKTGEDIFERIDLL